MRPSKFPCRKIGWQSCIYLCNRCLDVMPPGTKQPHHWHNRWYSEHLLDVLAVPPNWTFKPKSRVSQHQSNGNDINTVRKNFMVVRHSASEYGLACIGKVNTKSIKDPNVCDLDAQFWSLYKTTPGRPLDVHLVGWQHPSIGKARDCIPSAMCIMRPLSTLFVQPTFFFSWRM